MSARAAVLCSLMRILYGVVGEGMGHATRSAVVLEHLLRCGHEIKVVVSGRAHEFLRERFAGRAKLTVEEIEGLTLRYFDNRLDRKGSLYWNLRNAPKKINKAVEVYRKVAEDGFRADVVVSDFESWAALYGLGKGLPVVSVDNIQMVNRCKHDKAIKKAKGLDFRLARMSVKMKVPKAYHYLITTFFFPPLRKKYTTLVPPILRDEVIEARRVPGKHFVVYQRAMETEALVTLLRKLPHDFRVYGADSTGKDGNVTSKPFSTTGFLDDLRTARGVVSGGGFSLMSEAVTLGVPMLSVPIEHQFEQELNARYLQHLGYGRAAGKITIEALEDFIAHTDECAHALAGYERKDNGELFDALERLLDSIGKGKPRPKRLEST